VAFQQCLEQWFEIGEIEFAVAPAQEPFGGAFDASLASDRDPAFPTPGQRGIEPGIERKGER